jgi:hypothetical protein
VVLSRISRRLLLLALVLPSSWLFGQNPQLRVPTNKRFPTLIFSCVRWNANPSFYSIAIDSSGTATYDSAPEGIDKTGVAYTIEFQVSDRTRRIAFNLAKRLNYFGDGFGEAQSSPDKNNVHTLAYRYEGVRTQFTYSASSDPDVLELTSVFEELSQTFEYGRNLKELQIHNRKALPPQLLDMQGKAERHALRDLEALVPTLRGLASDTDLDPAVRRQAAVLLKLARNSNAGHAAFE